MSIVSVHSGYIIGPSGRREPVRYRFRTPERERSPPPPPRRRRPAQQRAPQDAIDAFWAAFTTKTPGKATSIIPQKALRERAARRASAQAAGGGQSTAASYAEAAAQCKAKVAHIVKECRRINQKYRDPHFDLEQDLQEDRRDCLESLLNVRLSLRGRSPGGRQGAPQGRQGARGGADDEQHETAPPPLTLKQPPGDRAKASDERPRSPPPGPNPVPPEPPQPSFSLVPNFNPQAVKRVPDIFDEPQFYVDGPTANDVRQGRDGDCWLMAALCTLSNKPGLIERVCVAQDPAVGVYGFVFHRDGEWFSEIIDDKLYLTKPDYDESRWERNLFEDRVRVNSEESYRKIYQSNSGALYFAQCENPNETWLPLLEKAYAKAHGDYAAIEGGFTGEGIEDLTGGVTSELYTTDILDKEYFWKEELLKVNETFLFGCSTGVWGRGRGDRGGIVELHAYSVMRAVEIDGVRLVLLKNPWGRHEWKGPWSDGSKEWTAEWIQKLNHRFGDDGSFWISYQDLLRKYQAFDRTRLFGDDWTIARIWTTMAVPWTLEYSDTKFAFTLARPGPVVLVLSQLDDRYFRGLEGQYRFELSFRLHRRKEKKEKKEGEGEEKKKGEEGKANDVEDDNDDEAYGDDVEEEYDDDDYVVRSQPGYRMSRSVSVELDLDAGRYLLLVKINAIRDDALLTPEEVVRAAATTRREKLIRIGLAYDLAHSKGRIVETPAEKKAREAAAARRKTRNKKRLKKAVREQRELDYLAAQIKLKRQRRAVAKAKAKRAAQQARRAARAEAKAKEVEAARQKAEEEEERKKAQEDEKKGKEKEEQANNAEKEAEKTEKVEKSEKADETAATENKEGDAEGAGSKPESEKTNDESAEKETTAATDEPANATEEEPAPKEGGSAAEKTESAAAAVAKDSDSTNSSSGPKDTPSISVSDKASQDAGSKEEDPSPEKATTEKQELQETGTQTEGAAQHQQRLSAENVGEADFGLWPDSDAGGRAGTRQQQRGRSGDRRSAASSVARRGGVRRGDDDRFGGPYGPAGGLYDPGDPYGPPGLPGEPQGMRDPRDPRGLPGGGRGAIGRGLDGGGSDDESEIESLSSLSDISDDELELMYEDLRRGFVPRGRGGGDGGGDGPGGGGPGGGGRGGRGGSPPPPPPPPGPARGRRLGDDDDDDDEGYDGDPWNAVAVVGLRVYYQKMAGDEERKDDIVQLSVERPHPFVRTEDSETDSDEEDDDDDDEEDEKKDKGDGGKDGKDAKEKDVLDVDDSLKDATEPVKEAKPKVVHKDMAKDEKT